MVLFPYNQAFQSALYQFKGCADIELAPIFLSRVAGILHVRYHDYWIVPVPSSPSHDEQRGFNQVVEATRCLNLPYAPVIKKPYESKQSDLSVSQRKKVGELLKLEHPERVRGKKILLVDDVFTTGSTATACLELLRRAGVQTVTILVFAKVQQKK